MAAQLGLTQYTETIYDTQGIQAGEKLPDLTLHTLQGESVALSAYWHDKPVLFVNGSYTCPVARRKVPEAADLAQLYKGRLNVVAIYVFEPHPKGDPSPYTGEEWVTFWNIFAGILHRQPRTLDERLELASLFNEHIEMKLPLLVDAMDNRYWTTLGEGPNQAILVDQQGEVIFKLGWFHKVLMQERIDLYLGRQ